ncbi:MAG: pyridoxal phosphate-dependent aminotransferase [Bacillota bacterium]|uniref:Aminotransferase n=1 Tax=[Clostridium] aminophilum TaxID=1526 RepID=A0A1I6JMH5_9FIRM|nr:pyridoxal phosphate-dependent aminotransferase [[Clostridium] aminophilum]MCR4628311.1 pyridoxal phosphate-dependent aminotransferase [Clostridium sp.]MDT3844844.1 pyridoxal phosphate-dependent aminotransferase [Bacillota bacterium]SFR80137.1 aspartate aminotransferase [[Clostridium] aminophilum]
MISEKMMPLLRNNSAIRMMFEEGNRLAALYGRENVYDFSLGNPSVPAPPEVNQAIRDVLEEEDTLLIHGYMSNSGYEDVREAIAQSLNDRFGTRFGARNLIMTVGAASALNIILKAVLNPDDEVLTFAPYFVEYGNYVRNYDGKLMVVPADTETFQPNLTAFESMINKRTKAVLINTPNNPTGVIYSEETIRSLAAILEEKQKEFGTEILLISDEPYRELAYDGIEVPYVTKFYANSVVCYSYSKSLSLPGERIGYVVIPDEVSESRELIAAAAIANRVIGSVNAPSLIQRVIKRCLNAKVNVEAYDRNRSALYDGLTALGFECVRPQGAFYMWVKSPVEDEKEFCDVCREHHILVVPGSSFACGGYVRIAYCVSYDMIGRSMPAFAKVAEQYGLKK